ncbi:MAG: hypothetical protein J0L84_15515 [Verrucomicrobia bacterium]|nr:hypothetical protein [Verrucomicrobiota bacterium]
MTHYLMWSMVGSIYLGWLSPVLLDGFTISSLCGVLSMGIIVTYVLTRIYSDRFRIEDSIARFIFQIMP